MAICLAASVRPALETEADVTPTRFVYPRAIPSIRWPQGEHYYRKRNLQHKNREEQSTEKTCTLSNPVKQQENITLALNRAKDCQQRVQIATDAICRLQEHEFLAETIYQFKDQLTPTDLCHVLKNVASTSWQRALELYEFLSVSNWYGPYPRMLCGILSVLGRANQPAIAQALFDRAESRIGPCVNVYNSLLSVYARCRDSNKVEELFCAMQRKGCQPDLVTFNIVIKSRTRSSMQDGLATKLLQEVYEAGLQPDTVTYNTLISACSLNNRLLDAIHIFEEMQNRRCEPDKCTYNTMISVYGRAGRVEAASSMFQIMQKRGLIPDSVTYNSVLHAFAKGGRIEQVEQMLKTMKEAGLASDEITYNTMIHMYGRAGMHNKAQELYTHMKEEGRIPDAVTYTVLIDSLGKAGLTNQAEDIYHDMVSLKVSPTLQVFSAMICAYAKVGMYKEAESIYDEMIRSGIEPDLLAYSVMLDVFYKDGVYEKCIVLYKEMMEAGLEAEIGVFSIMVRVFYARHSLDQVKQVIQDMLKVKISSLELCSMLLRGSFSLEAAAVLRLELSGGREVYLDTVNEVLDSLAAAGKYTEARDFVHFVLTHRPNLGAELHERLVVMHAQAGMYVEAEEDMKMLKSYGQVECTDVYKVLVTSYQIGGMHRKSLDWFMEMSLLGFDMDQDVLQSAVISYCQIGLPGVAHQLLEGLHFVKDWTMHIALMEAYMKVNLWREAERVFHELQGLRLDKSLKCYEALLSVYAETGDYKLARRIFEFTVRSGLEPTVSTANYVLQALGRSSDASEMTEFYHRITELGITPNLESFLSMLGTLMRLGRTEKARSMYEDMRKYEYFPTIQVFKDLLGLYARDGSSFMAEELVKDIKKAGLNLDHEVYNLMLDLYSKLGDYRKATLVFKGMKELNCCPNTTTYNTLISLYSRHEMVQEARSLLEEMTRVGNVPHIASYTTLIAAYGRIRAYEDADSVFKRMLEVGCKPDAFTYNTMINVYRKAGNHRNVEELIKRMKEDGFEPSLTTIHMLMDSYGKGGAVEKAEDMMDTLPYIGMNPDAAHYTSIITSHLGSKDYLSAVLWLRRMKEDGVKPTHVTITCFVGAASLCERTSHALMLLRALAKAGFPLPLRLLTRCTPKVVEEMQDVFDQLQEEDPDASQGVVNVVMDLLWAFRQCATAALVFALAIENDIYSRTLAKVKDRDWAADFRKLSPGAALVALILWLDQMQDASLQGTPEAPKSIQVFIGTAKDTNQASVSKTVKRHLWQMGSPFLPSKTKEGIMAAKAHSLCMWLKESPYCLDLELTNTKTLPETSAIQVYNGAFVWSGLVSAIEEIDDRMGEIRPKKYARLVHMTPEKRSTSIEADLRGRAEKLAKQLKVKLSKQSDEVQKKKDEKKLRKAGKMKQRPKPPRT